MYIKHIELTDFRNYENLQLDFHENVNLILGDNAQGKTNLLEAIYITSIGRSFRTNKDSELIKFDANMAKIYVEAEKEIAETCVNVIIKKDSKKSSKDADEDVDEDTDSEDSMDSDDTEESENPFIQYFENQGFFR